MRPKMKNRQRVEGEEKRGFCHGNPCVSQPFLLNPPQFNVAPSEGPPPFPQLNISFVLRVCVCATEGQGDHEGWRDWESGGEDHS